MEFAVVGQEQEVYEDPLDLMDEIEQLKIEKDAKILAHFYVDGDIQDIADYTGDSLKLARDAVSIESSTIVFSGVHFMGESAKILSPEKTVLMPDLQAGCSLAESCQAPDLKAMQDKLRAEGRQIQTVAYINTSAAVKSLCDWIVTSGNAREIVERIPADQEILFVPDQHLGRYLMEVTGREMILWPGSCMVHEIFSLQDMLRAKKNNPGSVIIAHPECPQNILEVSDFIGGTEKMRQHVASVKEPTKFLVATESAMIHPLEKIAPWHEYIPVPGIMESTGETCACNRCPHMARNTLQKVRDCLKYGKPEIVWQDYFSLAKEVLERSLLK
ncbi:quinolinate synthase NadA [Rubinisphaera sp.]|mgnify:FL=1|uniref:quinolinate synthase NadA n=1 Tax=Rubinisphaera sp. TaxID=2024857 RepID=UPI000C10D121|nr:quinolinate synthase NadA [Rubinisphaera sp.]MBV11071.1 quinolinate synthase [Rubinisphaera sp.]HCS50489.1 quinolinate synthase NadA [Planctomycetaceae bacterium]|tara:strand:- start:27320 stop:28309 length:990 start_codon:yes stop_codon:yes gene_type:complete